MIVADTSVAVAAALPWHGDHASAADALPGRRIPLIAHVAIETYSVLTRLPQPQRVPPDIVLEYLRRTFRFPVLVLPDAEHERLLDLCTEGGVSGGAAYDALVAATAAQAGATLLTLDRRALPTYELVGATVRLVR